LFPLNTNFSEASWEINGFSEKIFELSHLYNGVYFVCLERQLGVEMKKNYL